MTPEGLASAALFDILFGGAKAKPKLTPSLIREQETKQLINEYWSYGLASSLAGVVVPDPLKQLVANYAKHGGPTLRSWNHPQNSLYTKAGDVAYITDIPTATAHIHACNCKECRKLHVLDPEQLHARRLLHELAHSTGHEKRLNRYSLAFLTPTTPRNYAIEEIVAESVAMRLMTTLGFTSPGMNAHSQDYIEMYADAITANEGKPLPEILYEVEPDVKAAVSYLMTPWRKPRKATAPKSRHHTAVEMGENLGVI